MILLPAESLLPRVSAGSRITRTVSAGSLFSCTAVSAGSKRSRTVSAEARYDGQSLQEAKISGLVYTLWFVGCFGLNGPLRKYFSLYRAVSQREGERKEK